MSRTLTDDVLVHHLVTAAGAAPSIHNSQPWRFSVRKPDLIELHAEIDRMLWVADPLGRAMHLSCGAALFNLRLAVRNAGCRALVWSLPDPELAPTLIASAQITPSRPTSWSERQLFDAIWRRHSSRVPYSERPVPEAVRVSLEQEAALEGVQLRILNAQETTTALQLIQAADRTLRADAGHACELAGWIGAPAITGYGIPWQALGPRPDREPAPVRDFGQHPATERPPESFELQPTLALLSTARDGARDWLRAGQGLQRVLLAATRHGLSTSMLYQPVELHDMHNEAGWWPFAEKPQIIIRLGYGPPVLGSPRLPLTALLDS
jgi:nitroreductase